MEEGWTDARSVYRRARQCSAQGQGPTHPSGGHGRAQALRESLSEAIHGGLRNRDLCNCHLNQGVTTPVAFTLSKLALQFSDEGVV